MIRILCLETSTKNCSVALSENGVVTAIEEDGSDGYTHAEKLNVFIETVLKKSNVAFQELNAIAVSMGPGSYTGLRIGVSAAKGLSYGLGIDLIAVCPLKAMASQSEAPPDSLLIPMIDARRMEVFCAGFSGTGDRLFKTRAEIVGSDSFPEANGIEDIRFFGDGAEKCKPILEERGFKFIEGIEASARGMAVIAQRKYELREIEDVAYFEPFYLKDFVAGKKKKPAN